MYLCATAVHKYLFSTCLVLDSIDTTKLLDTEIKLNTTFFTTLIHRLQNDV